MPSPFPGMDPYLEDPNVFPNLHDKLIVHMEESIQPKLPESYFAKGAQRIWLEYADSLRVPDVSVLMVASPANKEKSAEALVAVAEMPVRVTAPYVPLEEFKESYLEIYSQKDGQPRLVTAIEVLSPSNKSAGDQARGAYREKQGEILRSQINLVEIDLLRMGAHTTAVPQKELLKRHLRFDYHVCVHEMDQPKDFFVYPIFLADRLPTIGIPLLPGDGPIHVDLQALLTYCYDRGPYRREINYSQDPPPPSLSTERLAWVKGVLSNSRSSVS